MSLRPQRTATLEDVARVAGVSRATVSRVISSVRNVDLEIQEAVPRCAGHAAACQSSWRSRSARASG